MLRHIFVLPYDGDPSTGFTAPASGFDTAELVQPDSGEPYPDPPADSVLVGLGLQQHDRLSLDLAAAERLAADGPVTVAEVDAYNRLDIEAVRAHIAPLLAEAEARMEGFAAELESDGFAKVGVSRGI